MTLTELLNEVSTLIYEKVQASDTLFSDSANRALQAIYIRRRITAHADVPVAGNAVCSYIGSIRHTAGTEKALPLVGRAYSFRVQGSGAVTVFNGKTRTRSEFNTDDKRFCGTLYDAGELTLSGNYSFVIHELYTFREVLGPGKEHIPESGRTVIDLNERFADFTAPAGAVTDALGNAVEGAFFEGGRAILPSGFCGIAKIVYFRKPAQISCVSPDEKIDIPEDCRSLLPLLTAAYMLQDTEPEKARQYCEEYGAAVSALEVRREYGKERRWQTNGWA